jgi:hypothetical protein
MIDGNRSTGMTRILRLNICACFLGEEEMAGKTAKTFPREK